MRYCRVLLLRPSYDGYYRAYLPTGLAWVAEALRRSSIACSVFDFDLGLGMKDLEVCLQNFRPDLVAMSMTSYCYKRSLNWLNKLKLYPEIDLLVGGPHVSAFSTSLFDDVPDLDWAILGEGEESLLSLCKGDPPHKVAGLIWKDGSEQLHSNSTSPILELDNLSFPTYTSFDLDAYPSEIMGIVTSRGCPHSCIFCNVATSMGKKLRTRSPASVIEEVKWWFDRGRRRFSILDDGFTENPAHAKAVCEVLLPLAQKGARFFCGNGIRADRVDKDLLHLMASAGFDSVAFGVESGDPEVRRRLGKPPELTSLCTAVKNAQAFGMDVKLHFVVGGPGETEASFEKSLALAWRLGVADASFNNLIPYPGTALERLARREGWLLEKGYDYLNRAAYHGDEVVIATDAFPRNARERALKRGRNLTRLLRWRTSQKRLRSFFGSLAPFLAALVNLPPLVSFLRSHPVWKRWALRVAKVVGLR